ncbi:hypothetical protein [Agreia pratensis]|uniref:Uncharacterized protein n=1 Tax=Agreia pratensis TaxID=150121 RepID=A0A1X7KK49_9MICO|nr:hypothetical protein [Agreia pratensis]SMG41382.1 hypothetical protein SAMN06296010_2595 [Agreia pratensis]
MNVTLVDERDIDIELPLPTFRVAVWETEFSVGSYNVVGASIRDVLAYADQQGKDAFKVEVFALMTTPAGQRVRILLDASDAPAE